MRTIEEILEKLENHCATRGAAAKLSRDLEVAKSTVSRWQEEKTIPDAMQKLLAWYLFGDVPPSLSVKPNLQNALVFDEDEWRIITYLAKRAGISEAAWIARHIREYLADQKDQLEWNQQKTETPVNKTKKIS
jgi:transcriptional regulator with XRE-family HTH domain